MENSNSNDVEVFVGPVRLNEMKWHLQNPFYDTPIKKRHSCHQFMEPDKVFTPKPVFEPPIGDAANTLDISVITISDSEEEELCASTSDGKSSVYSSEYTSHPTIEISEPASTTKTKVLKSKSPNRFDHVLSPVGIYINSQQSGSKRQLPGNFFKSPAVPKSTTKIKTTPIKPSSQYQSVISPVWLYINKTPKTPKIQNVRANHIPKTPTLKTTPKDRAKPNDFVCPKVVYKPSAVRKVISENTDKTAKIPLSVKKLVQKNPCVVSHTGRPRRSSLPDISAMLREDDLSIDYIGEGCSVLETKYGF